jgi:ABC-2 type transport system permease protein
MLWYKAWRDTRWRFLIGLVILSGTALGSVFAYPSVKGMLGVVIYGGPGDLVTQASNWVAELSANLRGYIWVQLIRNNMYGLWSLFAVLLGAEGVISRRSGAAFTLSLPVSRRRLCAVRAATDLAELLLLALVPMVLVTIAAPAIDSGYALADAVVHGISIFVGGAVFYCLALLLAAVFEDRWRPILIAIAAVIVVGVCRVIPGLAPFTPARVMDGESYFRTGTLAWAGLFMWAAAAAATLYAAVRAIEARDYS